MTQQQFRVGDRVKINERNSNYAGREGAITYYSGGQYWVKLDDSGEVVPALHPWMLDPA
jgi:hypothetical protein